ncbi:MAG: CPBP family intramembrane metalloprotease [Acidobacteria bacterium]|nr:CPBP family intramembrane metalloprotease [Acidobacteriota bacterium]MBI3473448.1 CPBP family intramembrane metalloprotease [Candidatus Solibacter usitatus]
MREPEPPPFWNYRDLAMLIGLAPLCFLAGSQTVKSVLWIAGAGATRKVWELGGQFFGYGLLFAALGAFFKWEYGRPLWDSLRGRRSSVRGTRAVLLGCVLALAIALLGLLLKAPEIQSPLKDMFTDRASLFFVALVGVTVGPLCEELMFRGFMQPLFVRSLGLAWGILAAGICFGLLHLPQYGLSWRHGVLITMAGSAFGWMRHASGSTLAATVMHGAYNLTLFAGFVASGGKDVPKTW